MTSSTEDVQTAEVDASASTGATLRPRLPIAPPPGTGRGVRTGGRFRRYFACIRVEEILVLQGPPFFGALFALRHPVLEDAGPLAILTIANLFLMAHVFLINDWSGLTADLADPNKSAAVFTTRGVGLNEARWFSAGLLVVSLALFASLGMDTLCLAALVAAISALYSLQRFHWKGRPVLSSLAHLAGGMLHVLLGYSLGSAVDGRGFAIAAFFAFMFVAGHLTQEVRDHEGDLVNGIRTNAVVFGPRRAFLAGLIVFLLSYALLVFMAFRGILPRPLTLLGVLIPVHAYWSLATLRRGLGYASVQSLQFRYRVLYAVIGLAMIAGLLAAGGE